MRTPRLPARHALAPGRARVAVPAGGSTRSTGSKAAKYQGEHVAGKHRGPRPTPRARDPFYGPTDHDFVGHPGSPNNAPRARQRPAQGAIGQPQAATRGNPRGRFGDRPVKVTDLAAAYPPGAAITRQRQAASEAEYERHRARDAGRREFMDITDRELAARDRGRGAQALTAAGARARGYQTGRRERAKAQYGFHEPPAPAPRTRSGPVYHGAASPDPYSAAAVRRGMGPTAIPPVRFSGQRETTVAGRSRAVPSLPARRKGATLRVPAFNPPPPPPPKRKRK